MELLVPPGAVWSIVERETERERTGDLWIGWAKVLRPAVSHPAFDVKCGFLEEWLS